MCLFVLNKCMLNLTPSWHPPAFTHKTDVTLILISLLYIHATTHFVDI